MVFRLLWFTQGEVRGGGSKLSAGLDSVVIAAGYPSSEERTPWIGNDCEGRGRRLAGSLERDRRALRNVLVSGGCRPTSTVAILGHGRRVILQSEQRYWPSSLAVILEGLMDVETDTESGMPKGVATIGAGDVVGWEALLPDVSTTFSARAREESRLWLIDSQGVDALRIESPRALAELSDLALRTMRDVLRQAQATLAEGRSAAGPD